MSLERQYPDYGTPGHPNTDPYYLSPAEEGMLEQEAEEAREKRRAALIEEIAEALSDTCDQDVSWTRYATAVVDLLELRKLLVEIKP